MSLQDPRVLYKKPPYDSEMQKPPGKEAKMSPVSDHGEHSYKGSGLLKGRRALITGADSGIGRAVAIAFAREGADVAIAYLSEDEDARIPATLPEEKVKNFGDNTVYGRAAQPCELAPVFVFLASEKAGYVTGEVYGVTGGRMPV